ncbi:hypothetical protein PO909_016748, partial [Leuciscus waleckii]
MSMTSYTSDDQRYCFTAILQSLWCFRTFFSLKASTIQLTQINTRARRVFVV